MGIMPPTKVAKPTNYRKPHSKSRLGCATCKRRQIKCDELFPQCLRCTIHKVKCSYHDFSLVEVNNFLQKKYFIEPGSSSSLEIVPEAVVVSEISESLSSDVLAPSLVFLGSPRSLLSPIPSLFPHCVETEGNFSDLFVDFDYL